MFGFRERLDREAECERLVANYGPDSYDRIRNVLDDQFKTVHSRAELLLGVCGVLISASALVTTGGRLLGLVEASHQKLATILLSIAAAFQIGAAAMVVLGVLGVRWMSQQPGADLRSWILVNLTYRDRKTRIYRVATVFVLLSLVFYQAAVTIPLTELE